MRKLTKEEINEAFLTPGLETMHLGVYWDICHYARRNHGVPLREALYTIRKRRREVSVFVDKIIRTSDLDDVVHVINALRAEITDSDIEASECLQMLQIWRARTLMKIVINKRADCLQCAG